MIAAMTPGNQVIGNNNNLLWNIPSDLKRFKELTTNKTILMGRKTYESIGRTLPNRTNIVISSNKKLKLDNCLVFNNIVGDAFSWCKNNNIDELFIIGGSQIYKSCLVFAEELFISFILGDYSGDSYFPYINPDWEIVSSEFCEKSDKDDCSHFFVKYKRKSWDYTDKVY